jgi:16S rRNA (guanine1516-N2)-methyltransferase
MRPIQKRPETRLAHDAPSANDEDMPTPRVANKDEPESIFDFVGGAVGYRFRSGRFRDHALVRATGVKQGKDLDIVDATAGLGRDAFLLASIGANVTLLERSPEVHELLRRSLAKANANGPEFAAVVARMNLIFGDARDLLPKLQADVVLIDPMHPPRGKTALVKKQMRVLRELAGADTDARELVQTALAGRYKRVVLKWPLRAPALAGLPKPSHSIAGKTVRFDVFLKSDQERW